MTIAPVIRTLGLTKRCGEERGIEDVTMTVEQGEVFGFLGPNGAGKTAVAPSRLPSRSSSATFKYYGLAVQEGIDPLAFAGLALVGAVLAAAGAHLIDRRDVR